MPRPASTEYAAFYGKYVALVTEDDVLTAMRSSLQETLALFQNISEEESCLRHPPYTWSIKEVVGHLTDSERIFGYRALRFAREDATPLAGFDETAYARVAQFDRLSLADLSKEWESVRRAHLWLFGNLPQAAWEHGGVANASPVSVRALAYIIVGHERHHRAIVRQRLAKG